jgi:hypothetical protein
MKLLVLSAALAVIELAPAQAQNFGVQGNTNLHTNNSVIVSGQANFVAASNGFIGSGTFNAIQTRGTYSFIGGGSNNVDAGMTNNFAKFSFIGGGANNRISPSGVRIFL